MPHMLNPGETSSHVGVTPELKCFTLGPFETNCYVVSARNQEQDTSVGNAARVTDCWIVDASFEPEPLITYVREAGLTPRALILTHAHVDHIAGVNEVVKAFSETGTGVRLPVWMHAAEREWLNDPLLNLSAMTGMPVTAVGPDRLLEQGEILSLAGMSWRVIHTPGHSPGGITLHHAESNTAIVGDTLFAGSVGRSDFPGSDHKTLERSIRTQLYTMPIVTRVYPGHGPPTTIDRERRFNPFVRA